MAETRSTDPAPKATNPDAAPAHALWVELTTRITTQNLHHRSGDEETAAKSVAKLFQKVRDLLAANPDAHEFEKVALQLINETLRPYTARWDGWMTQDKDLRGEDGQAVRKFKDEWYRRQFRRELRALQPRLAGFRKAFEALKDDKVPEAWWAAPDEQQLETLRAECGGRAEVCLGAELAPGIQRQVRFPHVDEAQQAEVTRAINEAELEEIRRRRAEGGAGVKNVSALAFSGGGIRSATFCLGITQVLARRGLLRDFDYLSTVSGGGYLGAFLSAYLGSGDGSGAGTGAEERIKRAFGPGENQREPRPLRHLRNHSRYLAEGKFKEKVTGIGMVAAGVVFNLLLVLPVPLGAVLLTLCCHWWFGWFGQLGWVDQEAGWVPGWDAPVSRVFAGALAVTGLMALGYPWLKARAERWPRPLACWRACFPWVVAGTVFLLSSWLVPLGFRLYIDLRRAGFSDGLVEISGRLEQLSGLLGLSLTAALGVVATRLNLQGRWGTVFAKLAILAAPLLYLYVFYAVGYLLEFAPPEDRWQTDWVVGGTAIMVLWGWWLVDINTYSPHGYYRDRLSSCYLVRPEAAEGRGRQRGWRKLGAVLHRLGRRSVPEGAATELPDADSLKLSELNASGVAPYHLINATVNLPSSDERELRGRQGDFFLFSQHYCGSPVCGYHATRAIEEADPHLNLGTAMAISGAAASSNMGWKSINSLRVLLTIANVRLGYWLCNPRPGWKRLRGLGGPGPLFLFREMFASQMDEHRHFVNLSDGGHIENLAVYELLRRRCKFIVCVDGGQEAGMECEDLMRLERYAAIDLGIKMHYDIEDLKKQPNGYSRAYGVMVKIDYAPPGSESERSERKPEKAQWGWMLYLKLAMVGYGPGYVMDYKRQHPAFPHESTGDQIFDEAQFEAYRALGEAAAESFFMSELIDGGKTENVEAWFEALVSALLPDNDEVFAKA